ncbi:MAG: hypothetical protein AAGC68_03560 [Verrucomicrobiota bacterium]
MRSPLCHSIFLTAVFAAFISLVSPPAKAQDGGPPANRESVGMPQISVIDKFLATEHALARSLNRYSEEDWANEYLRLYESAAIKTDAGIYDDSSRATIALILGVKASDGVLALKGRGVEQLNSCAASIEKLAMKLDVDPSFLQKANIVKHHANRNEWLEAFMNLGFLQHEVMRSLENDPSQKDEALLVIVGGWLQGGRVVTGLILENYDRSDPNGKVHISNILREPLLIKLMLDEMKKIDPELQKDRNIAEIMTFLDGVIKIIDIGMYDQIPREEVEWLNQGFERLIDQIAVVRPQILAEPE